MKHALRDRAATQPGRVEFEQLRRLRSTAIWMFQEQGEAGKNAPLRFSAKSTGYSALGPNVGIHRLPEAVRCNDGLGHA
jgi:hypothetical protein